jgi:hypothetical protein
MCKRNSIRKKSISEEPHVIPTIAKQVKSLRVLSAKALAEQR